VIVKLGLESVSLVVTVCLALGSDGKERGMVLQEDLLVS
jgi:hypothetical protein